MHQDQQQQHQEQQQQQQQQASGAMGHAQLAHQPHQVEGSLLHEMWTTCERQGEQLQTHISQLKSLARNIVYNVRESEKLLSDVKKSQATIAHLLDDEVSMAQRQQQAMHQDHQQLQQQLQQRAVQRQAVHQENQRLEKAHNEHFARMCELDSERGRMATQQANQQQAADTPVKVGMRNRL